MVTGNNQYKKKSGVPIGMIIGFSILFTPLFFIGIILIIGSAIMMLKKRNGEELNKTIGSISKENISNAFERPINTMQKNTHVRHMRNHEPSEKMNKEDRDNYKRYNDIKNEYEQTVIPVKVARNDTKYCQVCRNIRSTNTPYCELCGELFGEGLKCTFCKTKNELNAVYCKNCGVRFKR